MAGITYFGNLRQAPIWCKDFHGREHVLAIPAKIDPTAFTDAYGVTVTTSAGALQNATTVAVTTLTPSALANTTVIASGGVLIPAGTTLYFGGAKVATLTADAKIGDTALTVAALPTALSSGDVATYSKFATLAVPSGTPVGRTYAERDAFTAFGAAAVTDDELFLTVYDNPDVRLNQDIELLRHGTLIAENYLPNYTALSAAGNEVQTVAITGTLSAGNWSIAVAGLETGPIAYNANTAAIQAALDAAFGSSKIVAGGTAETATTLTFSGAGYGGVDQPLAVVDITGLTGATGVTVTETTKGGTPMLTKLRTLYRCIKGAQ